MNETNSYVHVSMGPNHRIVISRDSNPLIVIHREDWLFQQVNRVGKRHFIAWDFFRDRGVERFRVADVVPMGDGKWALVDARSHPLGRLTIRQDAPDMITMILTASHANRVGFRWWASESEVLYGFGEYGNGPSRPPGRWTTWTEEGPVGLGPLSRWLRWTGRVPIPRGHHATYAPSPSWLSSSGYGAWVDEPERIDWSLRGARRSLRIWGSHITLHLVAGASLKQVIERRATELGTPPMPAPWQFGPWNDAVRGEQSVLALMRDLRENQVPSSAVWVEDWTGSWEDARRFWMRPLSHEVNRSLYPHIEELAHRLHQEGFKFLGYFCPEVAVDTLLYGEALHGGHLVTDGNGRPVDIDILGNHHGELDLTRAETRQWIHQRLFAPALRLGFDGWMADFGEHLPVESMLADGTSGWETHNRYPVLWQSLHREFWERERPNGDYSFFVRSAGLQTPSLASAMWGGDSDTDWDAADGLATVVPQALSAGILGNAFWGTDIAGYMTFGLTRPSTKELYWRWTQAASLMPLMRTHHGTARPRNWHWSRDRETMAVYARYARLHALLFATFYTLASEAHTAGIPLIRPVWLEFPTTNPRENRQFLLGDSVLAAPVTRPRQTRWIVSFPPGRWLDWWTGRIHSGPVESVVDADRDRLPLFIREGAVIPISEGLPNPESGRPLGFIETLASPEGLQAASGSVSLLLWGEPGSHVAVILPGGTLTGHGNLRPDAASEHEAMPRPACLDHAPLLPTGYFTTLAPHEETEWVGVRWLWTGASPLTITLRVLNRQEI